MARPSRTGGKKSEAKARNASPAKGRKTTKTKRRIAPAATRVKRPSVSGPSKDLKEAREQQAATAEILKVIASSPSDVQPVFEAIVASANRLIGGYATAVFRFIEGYGHLAAFTLVNPDADEKLRAVFPQRIADVPMFRQAQAGEVLQIDDTEKSVERLRDIARARGFRSVLYVPLRSKGTSIGLIATNRRKPGPFSTHDVQLLQTFADQAVIAIENARLFDEVQARTRDLTGSLERQTATADILKVIASSPSDVQPVFNEIAQSTKRLLGSFTAVVTRVVDGVVYLAASTAENEAAVSLLPYPLASDRIHARVARTGQVVSTADIDAATHVPEEVKQFARTVGWRSMVAVPMLRNAVAIGTIGITRREVGSFDDKAVDLLKTFADQAVIAIENARLFNETKEALERQTATADILKVIASSPDDVQPVFDAIAASANRLIGGFSTAVYRVIDDIVHLMAFTPTSPEADEALKAGFPLHRKDVPPLALVQNGETTQIADAETADAQTQRLGRARGWRSVTFTPLMSQGAFIGFIACTRRETGMLADHHVQLLRTFADQAVIAFENVRLFDEVKARTEDLRESLQQQTATADVLKVISRSAFDLQTVLDTLVESAVRLCEADMAAITRQKGSEYFRSGSFGVPPEFMDYVKDIPVKPERATIAGRTLLEGKVTHVPDVHADPDYSFSEAQRLLGYPHTFLGVPLLREGKPIGALVLVRRTMRPFTDKQIELVQTFADQAVIAIENVRLFEEVQARTRDLTESLEQQTATSEVLEVISASPGDLEPVFQKMLENATRVCGANFGVMNMWDGENFRTAANYNVPSSFAALRKDRVSPPHPESGQAIVVRTHQAVHIEDVRKSPAYLAGAFTVVEMADVAGARSIIIVPMLKEDELIGVISIYRQEVRPFTDKQIALVETFTKQAVIAIENTRLLKELRQRTDDLSESLEQQTATSEVLQVISSTPGELEPVFRKMLENATRICEAKFAQLFLYEEEENLFRGVGKWNLPPAWSEFLGKNQFRLDPMTPLGRVAMTKQPVQVLDVLADRAYIDRRPGMVAVAELGGARTLLQVPMLKENELIGAFGIYRQEVRPFTDKQIALVQNFAAQAVIAIENTRLLNELRQRTDDLTASLEELRTAQDRLIQTEKLASLGQLTAGIAHEIKNPLNFVNNFSALSAELTDELNDVLKPVAMDGKVRGEVDELTGLLKDNLEKVVQHGKRADSIVKNMLLHSREGSREHRPADINSLLDESLNLAYHGARAEKGEFNITLQRDFDADAGTIELFPQEITRAFLNLISNGVYAATKRKTEDKEPGFEPTLRATTKNLGATVEIRIRDNGTGIPAEVQEKMFNPFFTTKPAGEGTGLGLSMTHDIVVKQHGGRIDVATEPGQFTEFTVVLPRKSNLSGGDRGMT